jgi:hypothetical protein
VCDSFIISLFLLWFERLYPAVLRKCIFLISVSSHHFFLLPTFHICKIVLVWQESYEFILWYVWKLMMA